MWRLAAWAGRTVLDIGCGTGYHLPRFAEQAAQVLGVEPHPPSLERAQRRVRGIAGASALRGSAEQLPVEAASVDVAHARFAYFWGPGAEPGLRELERVMRPGGVAFVIDNDWTWGQFSEWLQRSPWAQTHDVEETEDFWLEHGFTTQPLHSAWRFERRSDLERVIEIEFPSQAVQIVAEHRGTTVSYGYLLRHRRY